MTCSVIVNYDNFNRHQSPVTLDSSDIVMPKLSVGEVSSHWKWLSVALILVEEALSSNRISQNVEHGEGPLLFIQWSGLK